MAKVSIPDRTYIPISLKDKHSTVGFNNGRTFATDAETCEKLLLVKEKMDSGTFSATKCTTPGHSQCGEEGVAASKRPRMEEPQLHRLSLEGVGPPSDTDTDCGLGEMQAAGVTTMARSNSSSSSGCSSLHDSVECPEADLDLPTPTEEEERDTDSIDLGISRPKKDLTPSPGPTKAGVGCSGGLVGGLSPDGCHRDGSVHWFRDTDPSSRSASSAAQSLQACPNVSLSPLLEHRLNSISTVSSGRNSSFDDADFVPLAVGEVLIVSHGGLIKELVTHFIEDLNCKVPGGKGHALRVCPNTGVSRFMVTLSDLDLQPTVTCLLIHDKDHLKSLQDPGQKPLLAMWTTSTSNRYK